jgi:hypothetical protein
VVECAKALNGRLEDWDVVNESFHYYDQVIKAAGGMSSLAGWYRLAGENAPDIAPYLNEFDIIGNGGNSFSREGYKEQIRYLLDNGVPVKGIGMQGHTDSYIEPQLLTSILDDFSQFGLPIRVTEMDVNVNNEMLQASELYDYMLTIFSHPQTVGLTLWGHWEGNMWNNRRGLIRHDWTLKPSGELWKKTIFSTWWTPPQNLTTDNDGYCRFRGFKGTYEVSMIIDGITKTLAIDLTDSTDTVMVTLSDLQTGICGSQTKQVRGNVSLILGGRSLAAITVNEAPAEISLVDLRGKMIRSFTCNGQDCINWDGRGSDGFIISNGSYILCVRTRNAVNSRLFVMSR